MKKFSILFLLLSYLLLICADSPNSKIIGEWTTTDETGKSGFYVFCKVGSIMMIFGNLVLPLEGIEAGWKIVTSHTTSS